MSGQPYLSIGDVLSLLREEFPDVTISKIRFLESQGLLDPERTPSGYRKFYDTDVERLRWILTQQKENFLPLKVIKDRLDGGLVPSAENGGGQPEHRDPPAPEEVGLEGPPEVTLRSRMAQRSTGPSDRVPDGPPEGHLSPEPTAGGARGAEAGTVSSSERPQPMQAQRPAPEVVEPPGTGERGGSLPARPHEASPGWSRFDRGDEPPGVSGPPREAELSGVSSPARGGESTGVERDSRHAAGPRQPLRHRLDPPEDFELSGTAMGRTGQQPAAGPETTPPPSPGRQVQSGLTLAELVASSGMSADGVGQLETYGLLAGQRLGGEVFYGPEALVIAKLAAAFSRFGVEARHLRLYKNAAEREAGLFEQIVIPLLKQRNPEARRRSVEALQELSHLGRDMRAVLLEESLKRHVQA